jgi:hypothetical protein
MYIYINNVANLRHLICREVNVLFNDVVTSHNYFYNIFVAKGKCMERQ